MAGKKTEEGARNFGVLLNQIEDGTLHAELSDLVQKINAELHELSQSQGVAKGSLVLTLNFAHEAKGIVGVKAKVDVKMPKSERGSSVFWLTDGANLSPENPRQQKLPLKEVPVPKIADIPAETPKPARSV